MLDAHEYTVGWICAITVEYVAAKSFLEETYAVPEYVSANDNNNYTLGKIGQHNVVIAVLPDKGYGLVNAATVTTDLLHSFPNVRIGLMVGVGGGAPSASNDIRLGDVAVSSSVFHFEPRKLLQDEEPELWGPLDRPPMARYTLEGHTIDSDIDEVLERYPHMRRVFKRPDLDSDRLFQSDITHGSYCMDDQSCCTDPAKLVQRQEREDRPDNPSIHYGVITSSNMVMKDALKRDDLARTRGVICFEMEAAGLMSLFPCLIIRGICDYSDSHKNKAWQGYAAMAAAAYAKDLLKLVPLTRVEAERRMTDILAEVPESMARAEANVQIIRSKVESDGDREILEWLSPEDYSSQQNDCISTREPGTAQWVFDAPEFKHWMESEGQVLFCPGIPGAGKTIIASTVIDYLQRSFSDDTDIGLAYVYLNYKRHEAQQLDQLLASLLRQLSETQSALPESVRELYNKRPMKRPSADALQKTILNIATTYSRSFIVIDALDECQAADRCRDQFISAILALQSQGHVSILTTSRPIPDIAEQFRDSAVLEIRARSEDIQMYIDRRIAKSGKPILRTHSKVIKDEISKVVEGMFLLAQLHFDTISTKRTLRQIKDTLRTLPNGPKAYDQAYDEAMRRISSSDPVSAEIAMKVLLWITCAKRPLTIVEMQHALAVVIGDRILDEENVLEVDDMVSTCTGLVAVDEESNVVRLVHYTTQEYLLRTQGIWFPSAEAVITEHCLAYLHFDDFETGPCGTDEELDARLLVHPLYDYAAHNWGHHASHADRAGEELILALLGSQPKRTAASQVLMAARGARGYSQRIPGKISALHLAAYFGLAHIAATLLRRGSEPDPKDTYRRTPLSLAAANGHSLLVSLLLATGKVDVNSRDKDGRTAVSWAAAHGHTEIVRQLMGEVNVDISSLDDHQKAPSDWENANGHDDIVELITAGAQNEHLKPATIESKTALDLLIRAIKKGNEAAVRILLADIDINALDSLGRSALSWACRKGMFNLVKVILARDDVVLSRRDVHGHSELDLAVVSGHEDIVKLLLERNEINLNEGPTTPLHLAVREGYHTIATSLLYHGARPDAKDALGRSPLWYAASNGEVAIVTSLLEVTSSPINSPDQDGVTPIDCAVTGGHLAVMTVLQTYSYQHSVPDSDRTHADYAQTMTRILASDACVGDMTAEDSLSLLLEVAGRGHIDFVRCLLRKGIDTSLINTGFINSGPKLLLAFLLDVHRGYERSDWEGRDCDLLFLWAMKHGFTDVTELLLSERLPVSAYISCNPALLSWTAQNGYLSAVKQLVTMGASVNGDKRPPPMPVEERINMLVTHHPPSSPKEDDLRKRRTHSWTMVEPPISGSESHLESASDSTDHFERGDHRPTRARSLSLSFEQSLEWLADFKKGTPLFWAAANGHRRVVRFLLTRNARMQYWDSEGQTPLLAAVQGGHLEVVQMILDEGGDVDHVSLSPHAKGLSLLQYAAKSGDEKMVDLLIRNDVRIETEHSHDFTRPLFLAIKGNYTAAAQRLLDAGADIESGAANPQDTPLTYSCSRKNEEIVRLLLRYRPRVYKETLVEAARWGNAAVVHGLLENVREGETETETDDQDKKPDQLAPAMTAALKEKHTDVIAVLLQHSRDNEQRRRRASTMLFEAIKSKPTDIGNYEDMAHWLLDNGADIEFKQPRYGMSNATPLHCAIAHKNPGMMHLLLDRGADIESGSATGEPTPLLLAIRYRWNDGLSLLLAHGVDLHKPDIHGSPPLNYAIRESSADVVDTLVRFGASLTQEDGEGRTATDVVEDVGVQRSDKIMARLRDILGMPAPKPKCLFGGIQSNDILRVPRSEIIEQVRKDMASEDDAEDRCRAQSAN
ncbi:uncharacterized protein DSM5745_08500 [Aspergillus mulundensis]|uniref:Uncharacterized protein n=1 Tax=Aspergillus mulundensis TaxID=1810919 RepID=A0A3D8R447_9EURO|nr:hypothetical protein DSM5745_08500 [Aspergillus mulundensis]RDW68740.1 hypothetical protein DSM5745_08500 [Aspergillus mulundensis]